MAIMNTTGKLYDTRIADGKPVIAFSVDSDAGLTELLTGDLLTIKVEKYRAKRSLTANAYLWTLIGKIAEKTGEPRTAIYRHAITEAGVMNALVVREEIASKVVSMLTNLKPSGTGDFALEGDTKKGWTEIYFYLGSSKYNTAEMARLIDYVVDECAPLGIDTIPPDEIARLKNEWASQ